MPKRMETLGSDASLAAFSDSDSDLDSSANSDPDLVEQNAKVVVAHC